MIRGEGNADCSSGRDSSQMKMIDVEGNLDSSALKIFMPSGNTEISVISIIGPQTSGKSYLLNRLFGTNFQTLDSEISEYGKTTDGIWIGKCSEDATMFAIDVQGTDSDEHKDEGQNFDNKAALLAFAISNVMMLNMKVANVGQHMGGSWPLLETICKERVKLHDKSKTRIVFVLRDCKNFKKDYSEDLKGKMTEVWNKAHPNSGLRFEEYIEVSVVQLPDPDYELSMFTDKCKDMKKRLTTGNLQGPRDLILTADVFPAAVENVWTAIKDNEQLNIPSTNVLVSTHWCNIIKNEIIDSLDSNEEIRFLMDKEIPTDPMEFYEALQQCTESILELFDNRVSCYVEAVRRTCKREIRKKIFDKFRYKFGSIIKEKSDNYVKEMENKISSELDSKRNSIVLNVFRARKETFSDIQPVESIISPHVKMLEYFFKDFINNYKDLIEEIIRSIASRLTDYTKKKEEEIERYQKTAQRLLQISTTVAGLGAVGLVVAGPALLGALGLGVAQSAFYVGIPLAPEVAAIIPLLPPAADLWAVIEILAVSTQACAYSQLLHIPTFIQALIDMYRSKRRAPASSAEINALTVTELPEEPELALSSLPALQDPALVCNAENSILDETTTDSADVD